MSPAILDQDRADRIADDVSKQATQAEITSVFVGIIAVVVLIAFVVAVIKYITMEAQKRKAKNTKSNGRYIAKTDISEMELGGRMH